MTISWCYYRIQHIVQKGWLMLIPYEYKLMLSRISRHSTYCSELCGRCWFLMKISWSDYPIQHILPRGGGCLSLMNVSECCFPIQHTVQRAWPMLISQEAKLKFLPQSITACYSGCRFDKTQRNESSSWWASVRVGRKMFKDSRNLVAPRMAICACANTPVCSVASDHR